MFIGNIKNRFQPLRQGSGAGAGGCEVHPCLFSKYTLASRPQMTDSQPNSQALESHSDARSGDIRPADSPYIVFSGFSMGTADVVPGVSGGTMAVALGIYGQLLAAIASINVRSVQALLKLRLREALSIIHIRFLASLAVGMAVGIGLMVKVVGLPQLIQTSPRHVYSVFFGLVLASAVLLGRTLPTWGPSRVASLVFGAVFGFAVVNLVPVSTPDAPWFIFLCGFFAICAMVLPGISGSFVLLILGKYAYVLDALGHLNFAVIVPFALGCAVGITSFSRLVAWALAKFHDTVLASLVGLLVGSLWRIWPYQELTTIIVREKPRVVGAEPFLPQTLELPVILLGLLGIALVFGLESFASARSRRAVQHAAS